MLFITRKGKRMGVISSMMMLDIFKEIRARRNKKRHRKSHRNKEKQGK
jgi:hypothetical protein